MWYPVLLPGAIIHLVVLLLFSLFLSLPGTIFQTLARICIVFTRAKPTNADVLLFEGPISWTLGSKDRPRGPQGTSTTQDAAQDCTPDSPSENPCNQEPRAEKLWDLPRLGRIRPSKVRVGSGRGPSTSSLTHRYPNPGS